MARKIDTAEAIEYMTDIGFTSGQNPTAREVSEALAELESRGELWWSRDLSDQLDVYITANGVPSF